MQESTVNTPPLEQPPTVEGDSAALNANRTTAASEARPREGASKGRWLALLLIGLTVLATYYNSMPGQFVQDDIPQIAENPMAGDWHGETLKKAFTRDFWANVEPDRAGDRTDSVYYRPIFLITLMVGHSLAGKQPGSWHLIALLLHLMTAALAFLAIDGLLARTTRETKESRTLMSALATMIFVVHPVQSESVAWISGLVGPLSTALMLGAFICYLLYRDTGLGLALAGSVGLFLLAALTKEQTLVLPLIILFCEIVAFWDSESARPSRRGWIVLTALSGVVFVYLASRYAAIGVVLGRSRNLNFPDDASLTLADQLRTTPALLLQYIKAIFYPVHLSFMYAFGYVRHTSLGGFWVPLATVAGLSTLLIYGVRKSRTFALAMIWVLIPLIPHLNTRAFVSEEIIHDRYLYGSMIGIGIGVAWIIWQVSSKPLIRASLGGLIVLVLAVMTMNQNLQWRTHESLWTQAAASAPNSRLGHLALGALAEERRDAVTALGEYESILKDHPDVIDALNDSALLSGRIGRWPEAVQKFERIVELTPDKAIAHFNLSFAYAVQKRYADAAWEQRTAIELDPKGARADEWRSRLGQLEKAMAAAQTSSNSS